MGVEISKPKVDGVDEIPIPGREEAGRLVAEIAARFGVPAFVRRARGVQDALDNLVRRCQLQREKWLDQVRIPWNWLLQLAGTLEALRPLFSNSDSFETLNELAAILGMPEPVVGSPAASARRLRNSLHELRASIERFNRRWHKFLLELNLAEINKQREDYNRYYVLEKECALRSVRLARQGFVPLAPVSAGELLDLLPLLPVPEVT